MAVLVSVCFGDAVLSSTHLIHGIFPRRLFSKALTVFSKAFVQYQLSDPYTKTMRTVNPKRLSFVLLLI